MNDLPPEVQQYIDRYIHEKGLNDDDPIKMLAQIHVYFERRRKIASILWVAVCFLAVALSSVLGCMYGRAIAQSDLRPINISGDKEIILHLSHPPVEKDGRVFLYFN